MIRNICLSGLVFAICGFMNLCQAQSPSDGDATVIREKLNRLNAAVASLKRNRPEDLRLADVEICAKGAEWILRHNEFYKPEFGSWTIEVLDLGLARAADVEKGHSPWVGRSGSTIFGYPSAVDGSVQPFAVALPREFDVKSTIRWPLHIELHGRGATLNEVSFIHSHEARPLKAELPYIQLDVFGRTNNAYRWAGETDVLEAFAAVKRLFRIDDDRVTLRGFSMGGAGAWHLGLHRPSLWSSVGAGAGFCDTIHHLSLTEPLSPLHARLTKIYDAQDYALNAFNVPVIGYGGELDKQIFASKRMTEKAAEVGVTIPRLIGPNTEHKWHPDSLKEFMEFHAEKTRLGRPKHPSPAQIRFVTYTPKYHTCFWLTVEEQIRPYDASIVEATVVYNSNRLNITTKNIAVLQVARDIAETIVIDGGQPLPLNAAAENRLPGVYFEKGERGWNLLDYERSHKYLTNVVDDANGLHKRHNLQGPIDDAFMEPFVCVRPTGKPWSESQARWSQWTLSRFQKEFDKWMRAQVAIVDDTDVTEEMMATRHLILFGDPSSNSILAKVVGRLPVQWSKETLEVKSQRYDNTSHGVALIYPNPLNPRRYVVVNSGHTFHDAEFTASNANLFPKLGDIAVVKFSNEGESFSESVLFSEIFDCHWQFDH